MKTWIKIKTVADLPTETQPCYVSWKGSVVLCIYHKGYGNRFECVLEGRQVIWDVDAWQPLVKPEL